MIKILELRKNKKKYLMKTSLGEIMLVEDTVIKYILSINKSLTEEEYKNIVDDNNYFIILDKCINLLVKSMHTEKEIIKYLNRQNIVFPETIKYLDRLKELKLLNDLAYAKQYVYIKSFYDAYGPNKIKYNLSNKGVENSIILEALSDYSDELAKENIIKLINQELKSNKRQAYKKYILKFNQALVRKGYNYSMINSMLNEYKTKLQENCLETVAIEKEYQILKLKKFSNSEIRNKLYTKGYNKVSIEDVMKES